MIRKIQSESAAVAIKSAGAELTSLKTNDGTEYLWQGDPTFWHSQAPVLFPIVGGLRDKKAVVGGGKICNMERHGLVRHMEFSLKNGTQDSATFSVCSTPETRQRFPYDFELDMKYSLSGKTLTEAFIVTNKSGEPMPYFVGGHPAFRCPLFEGEKFEDYVLEFKEKEYAECPRALLNGLVDMEHRTLILNNSRTFPLDRSWFAYDCQIFDQLKSRSVKLYNPGTGRGVKLDFAGFDYLVVWSSKNGGNFLAVEPWSGLSTCSDEDDVFENKRGVKFLQPGASATHSFDITLL